MVTHPQRMLSRQEAANIAGESLKTIDRAIRNRKLSSSKPCGRRLISESDLGTYLSLNRTESSSGGRFASDLAGEQRKRALQRSLAPLMEAVMEERWGAKLEELNRRLQALEQGMGIPHAQTKGVA